jgi:hypothetical protein
MSSATKKRGILTDASLSLLSSEVAEPPTRRLKRDIVTTTELETIKAELEYERSQRELDAKRAEQLRQRLERQVEFALQEAQEAKQLLEETREKSERHIQQLREARSQAIEELRECQMVLEEERADAAEEALETNPDIARLEARLEAHKTENMSLKETIKGLRQELEEVMKGNRKIADDEDEKLVAGAASEVTPNVLKELNRVRIELAEAERKNRQLRRTAEDYQKRASQLPKEREAAKEATERARNLEEELRNLHETHEASMAQMKSWKDFGKAVVRLVVRESTFPVSIDDDDSVAPEIATVRRFLDEINQRADDAIKMQEDLQNDLDKTQEINLRLESATREYDTKEALWKQEKTNLEEKVEQLSNQVDVQKAQEHIWKREVESLRTLVKSFDELPLSPMKKKPGSTSWDATSDASSQATIKTLELAVETARNEIKVLKEAKEVLTNDLKKINASKDELQAKHNTVVEKFGKIREAVVTERNKAQQAEARAIKAESLAGKGSFDPEQTRVLHLKKNPLVDALREENRVLKRQIDALSSEHKQKATTTTAGADVDPEKLHQRLKQSFKEQIGRFREGVYLMTGYKIDMLPGKDGDRPMFRVRSLYAEREEDHLMFKWPEGDDVSCLDLLSTDMAKILATTPSYEYMTKFHSLPAFLAGVQLSLFEKQTVM